MTLNPAKIRASSILPGFQNVGVVESTAYISGTIPANNGTLNGVIILTFPFDNVVGTYRANFPDANGELATGWFPIDGGGIFTDKVSHTFITLLTQGNQNGRQVAFQLQNNTGADIVVTNWRINIYAHLFFYPWAESVITV